MKFKIAEDIRNLFQESKNWVELEIEYAKLTLAEKLTMLLSTLIIGFVCLLLSVVVLVMFAFALAEVWKLMMSPGLAYLATGGVFCLLVVILYLFRKPLLLNPIARMLTQIFLGKKNS